MVDVISLVLKFAATTAAILTFEATERTYVLDTIPLALHSLGVYV